MKRYTLVAGKMVESTLGEYVRYSDLVDEGMVATNFGFKKCTTCGKMIRLGTMHLCPGKHSGETNYNLGELKHE